MNIEPLRLPSAVAPVAMSLGALALVVVHVARYGFVHETDEGTSAHLFQLLMVMQAPIILYFAARWLPQAPKQGMVILALQLLAASAAFAAVFVMESMS